MYCSANGSILDVGANESVVAKTSSLRWFEGRRSQSKPLIVGFSWHLKPIWLPPQPYLVATSTIFGCHLNHIWLPPQPYLVATSTIFIASTGPGMMSNLF